MPRKVVKKRKRSVSVHSSKSSSGDEGNKRDTNIFSKFEDFDLSEVLQKQQEIQESQANTKEEEKENNEKLDTISNFTPVTSTNANTNTTILLPEPTESTTVEDVNIGVPTSSSSSTCNNNNNNNDNNNILTGVAPNTNITNTSLDFTSPSTQDIPIPMLELIPPEPPTELPPDEEFVPLAALQAPQIMNRNLEAQSGLLKEPAAPVSIKRVTEPGVPAPAMPTELMELLTG